MTSENVVWITVDSLRYDHTSLSGYHRETTPNLARLASKRRGASFEHCIAHGKWTGTSTASMLTGTHPPTHGIYGAENVVLGDAIATVPELLSPEYTSVSVISNPNAGPVKGLDRGFDDVIEVYPSRLLDAVGARTALKTIPKLWSHGGGITTDLERHKGLSSYMMADSARRLLSELDDPYFAYLHFNSGHHAYLPPVSHLDAFTDEISASPSVALQTAHAEYDDIHELIAEGLTDEEWASVEAMYDAVLTHVDRCLGWLIEAILRDDDCIVVVTADHGDLLGEYGLAGHKFALHDALVHVPLVTYGLDGIEGRYDDVVQHVDVVRTLCSQLGAVDAQLEGIDLTAETREFAVSQRSGRNARKNLTRTREYDPQFTSPVGHPGMLTAIRSTEYKLLYSDAGTELFSLPDESTDVSADHEAVFERMKAHAERWLQSHDGDPGATKRNDSLESDIEKHLSDMGYLV